MVHYEDSGHKPQSPCTPWSESEPVRDIMTGVRNMMNGTARNMMNGTARGMMNGTARDMMNGTARNMTSGVDSGCGMMSVESGLARIMITNVHRRPVTGVV